MTQVLRHTLVVRNPETFAAVALIEGDCVPEWAAGLVHPDDKTDEKPAKGDDAAEKSAPAKKSAAARKPSGK